MTDVTQATTEAATDDSKRKAIAKREWIDGAGESCQEQEAVAVRYTFLADGKSFDYPIVKGTAAGMLAGFGALTLMGNIVNTWKNLDGEKAESPVDDIVERFKLLESGEWIDRTREGGVGAKIDKDALAAAIVEWAESKGQQKDLVEVREKLEDNPGLVRTMRANAEIAALYTAKAGKPVKTADELLGML